MVYILVTGNNGDDYGPFKLAIDLAKEGSSLATATFIGSDAKMEVSGSTQGYSDTYVNTRCNGNVTADGPDVVRGAAWRVAAALLFCTAMSQSCLRCNAACSAVLQSSFVCVLFCLGAARGGLPATHPAARRLPCSLQFYSYSSAIAGMVKVKACGTGSFDAKVVIMKDSGVLGKPNIVVACGSCSKPAV